MNPNKNANGGRIHGAGILVLQRWKHLGSNDGLINTFLMFRDISKKEFVLPGGALQLGDTDITARNETYEESCCMLSFTLNAVKKMPYIIHNGFKCFICLMETGTYISVYYNNRFAMMAAEINGCHIPHCYKETDTAVRIDVKSLLPIVDTHNCIGRDVNLPHGGANSYKKISPLTAACIRAHDKAGNIDSLVPVRFSQVNNKYGGMTYLIN